MTSRATRDPARSCERDPARLPLTSLAGVGPARAEKLRRLGLGNVRDLLFFVPHRLQRIGNRVSAAEAAREPGSEVSVVGRLRSIRLFRRGGRRSVVSFELFDATGALRAFYFNQPWLYERLREHARAGTEVELSGRVGKTNTGPALPAPRMNVAPDAETSPRWLGVYPLTEGIGQEFLRRLGAHAAERFAGSLTEPLDAAELDRLSLPALADAVREVHGPSAPEAFERARARLALERLFFLQARLARAADGAAAGHARPVRIGAAERDALFACLPHVPTAGQARVLGEILADLERTRPMRRLLQGEVGSGKTLVALVACAAVARAGGQAALLAPTEILAEQHHLGLAPRLEALGLSAVLLTGSQRAGERRAVLSALARNEARLAVGTHALFSSDVDFARLDLVVIDEQQRFGVAQKRALLEKGRDVHVLLMTATPIPRTLALCFYGDLETSLLAERPPGRGTLETHVFDSAERTRAVELVRARLERGERAFWISPRIDHAEESEDEDPTSAIRAFESLSAGPLAAFGVELVHGRLSPAERARAIERFRAGKSRLLVGTTIVEVGVDVPEASAMVIEGAERFGLSQLHQLRGRVGRGARDSICVLLSGSEAGERLRFLEDTASGFEIAEEDLRRRGMGDLAGLRQAGENVEGLTERSLDLELVRFSRERVRGDPAFAERYSDEAGAPRVEIV